jgi:replicative DNA helicase
MAIDKKCQIVFFDYIQIIRSEGKHRSRNEEMSYWCGELKNLAKELPDTAVVGLSQLNRGRVDEPNYHPQLSDLRDSGSLEQDATMVIFTSPNGATVNDNTPCLIDVAKNRNGKTGECYLTFQKNRQRFVEGKVTKEEAIEQPPQTVETEKAPF